MNGKLHEGLSEAGLIAHIANTIGLWRAKPSPGTRNDCKLLVSQAVRGYRSLAARWNGAFPAGQINRLVNVMWKRPGRKTWSFSVPLSGRSSPAGRYRTDSTQEAMKA